MTVGGPGAPGLAHGYYRSAFQAENPPTAFPPRERDGSDNSFAPKHVLDYWYPMRVTLSDKELRILGVLIEKALSQPAYYPMTMNAVTLAANQKQNRDPVEEYSEGEVAAVLRDLQHKQLVAQAPPDPGARATRFLHRVVEVFHWDRREQAIMAELILRGRQTAGELRTHASRMTPFADLESIHATIKVLASAEPPFVEELPREPGRSANRFRHLLSAETAPAEVIQRSPERNPPPETGKTESALEEGDGQLISRVASLEKRVDFLEYEVKRLNQRRESVSTGGGFS